MSINISVYILKYRSILSLVLYPLFIVGSRSDLTRCCVVSRTVAVASSFLILHLSISSFSVVLYFFSPDDTPHIPNYPSKSLERDRGSSVGEMDVSIELTPTSHVLLRDFHSWVFRSVDVTINVTIMV